MFNILVPRIGRLSFGTKTENKLKKLSNPKLVEPYKPQTSLPSFGQPTFQTHPHLVQHGEVSV